MRKTNKTDIANINVIMLRTIANYASFCARDDERDISSLQMYADDVQHNAAALQAFNSTKNAQALHDSIMRQDTFVREYFIETLRYIENNALIPTNRYCCI
jgi:hypothetical protein